uniref:Uncharacterized protein n=1 Tax=Glossina palpalis gambiensis TaxID=67801 RepID=A0A1B0B3Y3_9MUSC
MKKLCKDSSTASTRANHSNKHHKRIVYCVISVIQVQSTEIIWMFLISCYVCKTFAYHLSELLN